jgi:hypothetical protein
MSEVDGRAVVRRRPPQSTIRSAERRTFGFGTGASQSRISQDEVRSRVLY